MKISSLVLMVCILISGCATNQVLPEPGSKDGTRIVENDYVYSYSIARRKLMDYKGYLVRLEIKNLSHQTRTFSPELYITDSDEKVIGMGDLEFLISSASRVAGAPIPADFLNPGNGYSSFTAEARDRLTGRSYNVQGSIASGSAFSRGFSQGMAIAAAMERGEASKVLDWAKTAWLKDSYAIPPGVTVTGEVFMAFLGDRDITKGSRLLIMNKAKPSIVRLDLPPEVFD